MPLPSLLTADPSAAPSPSTGADGPSWTDKWSAFGTVGATVFALIAIVVTIALAWQAQKKATAQRQEDDRAAARLRREDQDEADRRRREDLQRAAELRQEDLDRAAREREEADRRLRDERSAADQRLLQERADWDRRQIRDWQAASAIALLHRIAEVQSYIEDVALVTMVRGQPGSTAHQIRQAVDSLQQGAYTDALALGSATGTELYRNLVSLVVSAPDVLQTLRAENPGLHRGHASVAIGVHLRAYCRYVRLRLCELIETGVIPPETGGVPSLRLAATGGATWSPLVQPPGWQEDTNTDPADPQFTPRS
ncbi:hypothetical protein [Kitasatospora sp. NPDC004272]